MRGSRTADKANKGQQNTRSKMDLPRCIIILEMSKDQSRLQDKFGRERFWIWVSNSEESCFTTLR